MAVSEGMGNGHACEGNPQGRVEFAVMFFRICREVFSKSLRPFSGEAAGFSICSHGLARSRNFSVSREKA